MHADVGLVGGRGFPEGTRRWDVHVLHVDGTRSGPEEQVDGRGLGRDLDVGWLDRATAGHIHVLHAVASVHGETTRGNGTASESTTQSTAITISMHRDGESKKQADLLKIHTN